MIFNADKKSAARSGNGNDLAAMVEEEFFNNY